MILTLLLLAMTPQDRFEAGDPAAALDLLNQAPAPTDPVWRYNHAVSAHAAGELSAAMVDYEWLTQRDPEDDAVRINRLLARLDRGAGDDAEPPLGQLARLPVRTVTFLALLLGVLAVSRRRQRDALFRVARVGVSGALVLLGLHQAVLVVDDRAALSREVGLRERPEAKARVVLEVPEGNLLSRLEARQGWTRVRTGSGVVGWVKSAELMRLDGVKP
ncbi:MAG: SH3 domain-containing protein [Myxococcota bacterium]|nr:SH3 domain-containing protein [Myxococcota bacterium]